MRSPHLKCLLCESREATQTNSHFTPAGLIKTAIGSRDKEEAYAIDGEVLTTEIYYGRSNLKNTSTAIVQNPHTADYVFCPDCEKAMADLESQFIPFINDKIRNPKYAQQFKVQSSTSGVACKISDGENPIAFGVFILSIIWRQCIEAKLDGKPDVLSVEVMEQIRNCLNNYINGGKEKCYEELKKHITGFTIVTTDFSPSKQELNWINPYSRSTNPEIFLVNEFSVLLHLQGSKSVNLATEKSAAGLPKEVLSIDFLNNLENQVKVVFVKESDWQKHLQDFMQREVDKTIKSAVERISSKRNIHPFAARILFGYKMMGIDPTRPDYMDCMKKVVDDLCA